MAFIFLYKIGKGSISLFYYRVNRIKFGNMADRIVLRIGKFGRVITWFSIPVFLLLLFLAIVEALETEVSGDLSGWAAVAILGIMVIFIPYLNLTQKIVITENDITVRMLFEGKPIPIDTLEEVRFVSFWGFPKPKKNVLNIGPGFDNKKAALEFLEGKVKITGAEKIK